MAHSLPSTLRLRKIFFLWSLLFSFLLPMTVKAVTDKEMDEARLIATKNYLRYVNNGSGYLDDVKVSSMEELINVLHPKEKENLKAFQAIKVPGDYKSWNKEKLVEFWTVTAFNTSGLDPEGKKAIHKIKKQINAMKVSDPVPEEPKEETPPPAEEPKPAEPAPAPEVEEEKVPVVQNNQPTSDPITMADSIMAEEQFDALEALEAEANADQEVKEESHNWVYILALAILVAIVLGLVVFASNVIKKSAGERRPRSEEDYDRDELEEHFSQIIADKDAEINMLARKLESSSRRNSELSQRLEVLTREIAALKEKHTVEGGGESLQSSAGERRQPVAKRTLFLGRATARGVFIRADRKIIIGHSFFMLETINGFSGTFSVIVDPEVQETALKLPGEYLGFACLGQDLNDTAGVTEIVTDVPGTAVFEGGCWRVTRKARIHYE